MPGAICDGPRLRPVPFDQQEYDAEGRPAAGRNQDPMIEPSHISREDDRRVVFAALVEAQGRTRSLRKAKQEVLAQFGVTWSIIDEIEREGMNNEWPPLDEPN
jgi:hypothetical protein